MKLFSALYQTSYTFDGLFNEVVVVSHPSQLEVGHGALLLHGGADISPALYHTKPSKHGHGPENPSTRDVIEKLLTERAVELNIPVIGICRGAQMLCILDGGTLIQHVEKHAGYDHTVHDKYTGRKVIANSAHHQVMRPREWNDIIGVTKYPVSAYDNNDKEFELKEVPEFVHFPKMKGLGIQGHPEWAKPSSDFVQYCKQLIQERLFSKEN